MTEAGRSLRDGDTRTGKQTCHFMCAHQYNTLNFSRFCLKKRKNTKKVFCNYFSYTRNSADLFDELFSRAQLS